jgi:rubrerythrin
MKSLASFTAFLTGLCCMVLCLCSCGNARQNKKAVDQDTLRLMQKTQAELAACVERCRSAATESKDKEILLALANSQQILADRHETIITILLKKYKFDRISTASYSIEMDPRTLVHAPLDEYKDFLAKADPQKILPEILIALEITNKVLESDMAIETLINADSEEPVEGDFYLCPICGQLTLMVPEGNCPVCASDKDRIIKLQDGELPPRNEESFISASQ